MKTACTLIFSFLAALQVSPASAQVYQWKDASGRTVVSDVPPPASAKDRRTVATPAKLGPGEKTYAEKSADFKKRVQETGQKADKDAKDLQAAAERNDYCSQARRHLATLESGERLAIRDDSGNKRLLEDAERQQEIERIRKAMAEFCK